jgi:DNA-binding CsgD family transcriptional regulator/tetratricopeptide (TPR) repeat protein
MEELTSLLATHTDEPPSPALTEAIMNRSEGNPFFAEELLAAAGEQNGELPRALRDLLLQRVARLDRTTQAVLRLAAAAGRDVGYSLLREAAGLPESDVRDSLRRAVEHGILVADQATSSFRFRHALLADAIYSTLLPGEREELHARLADELARQDPPASAAELAPHWAAAGRAREALAASIDAAREAESVFGLAEALAHLERALTLWSEVPDGADRLRFDLAELCAWTASLASQTGWAPRAADLAERAIALVGDRDALRAGLLHERLGGYLHATGKYDAGLAARERALELVPTEPPSAERARVLAAFGNALMMAWRHDESLAVCEQALAVARSVHADDAEVIALAVLGADLAYLGRGDEGLAQVELALRTAEERGNTRGVQHAYIVLTDVLTMIGRARDSARLAATALDGLRRYGLDNTMLVNNQIEALVACGEWDEADAVSAAALRATTASWAYLRFVHRAEVEIGRGDFDSARVHLDSAPPRFGGVISHGGELYDFLVADLALWERRWMDADDVVREALTRMRGRETALLRVRLYAQGLRAHAELAALARAHKNEDDLRHWFARADELLADARDAAAEAADVTPYAEAWHAVAEAEHARGRGEARPEQWSRAAAVWDELDRPPLAAYCGWRHAEALVAGGATRAEAAVPLQQAHVVATRLGAQPLLRELALLAERARLPLEPPATEPDESNPIEEHLGLTRREAEVLALVARGLTNREIAAELVISVKTASVHVSHILRKLDAPNRLEAAAIAHRVGSPNRT